MPRSCLCIGGPKDGQHIGVGEDLRRGDVHRIMLMPPLPPVINDEVAPEKMTYDTFLYVLDYVNGAHWCLRPYDEPFEYVIDRLFENYRPRADFDLAALQRDLDGYRMRASR